MSFKDTYPFSGMNGGKIDPISEIRNAGIVTSGNVFWVKDPSDADYVEFKDAVGNENLFDTIQAAINKCTSDQNDYVLVCPKKDGSAWSLGTAAIDLDEDNVHLLSVGYGRSPKGYTNAIAGYASTATHDDEFLSITGKGCEVAGFRFVGTGAATASTGLGTIDNALVYIEADEAWIHDCHFDVEGSASTAWNKLGKGVIATKGTTNGALVERCTLNMGTMIAGTVTLVNVGNESANNTFRGCDFVWYSGATDHQPIIVGTGDTRLTLFDSCKFVNYNAATAPASLANGNVTAEEGAVLFHYCSAVGVTSFGTDNQVYQAPTESAGTIAIVTNPGIAFAGSATGAAE